MKELKIEKFDNTTKNALINIKTNEYCLYNSKKHNKKIIGFYTMELPLVVYLLYQLMMTNFYYFHIFMKIQILLI